ncbi:MAG TPA: TetR/AcrR family transcriptional regulator [Methylomirabilota bacterium]|nr:TetR/AcrR family transcriptional regulator [Methylomirabilota bacterium]
MASPAGQGRRRPTKTPAARDLANELLKAAAALIAERGPQRFSLREVARRARVSEAAPYWHFASKEALVAGVAEQGFTALAALMAEVRRRVKDPHRQLQQLGVAYVQFALTHPSHLRVMFGPEVHDKSAHPSLKVAAERAFSLLGGTISEGQRAGRVRHGDPEELAVAAWALVHGLSALLIDGQLSRRLRSDHQARLLATRVTKLLQNGLAR